MLPHELRNPLATIRLRTQMSLRSNDSAQFDRSAHLILEEIDRLTSVLERLLYFAKPIQLNIKSFDPVDMCEDVVTSLAPEAQNASIDLHFRSAAKGRILGDSLKLRQVVENLIRNAMESFDGTAIADKTITVSVNFSPAQVQIAVEDNGIGLPNGASTKIFDPFFTTKARGTGLGLSIANEIVRAHQGSLELKPAAARGTLALLTLPREAAPQAAELLQQRGVSA